MYPACNSNALSENVHSLCMLKEKQSEAKREQVLTDGFFYCLVLFLFYFISVII